MQPDGKTPRNRPYATFAKATKDLVAPAFATAPAKDASGPPDDTVRQLVWQRLPWLVWLMLLQSLTVAVMERYQGLVDDHMVIASFITMLVGGGSNISSQVVANIVSRVARASERKHGDVEGDEQTPRSGSPAGDIGSPWKALMTEVGASCVLGVALCFIVLPRVLWEDDTTKYDGIAITLSYAIILVTASFIGAGVTLLMQQCGASLATISSGAPPTVQVLGDIVGIFLTCNICMLIMPTVSMSAKQECMVDCANSCADGVLPQQAGWESRVFAGEAMSSQAAMMTHVSAHPGKMPLPFLLP